MVIFIFIPIWVASENKEISGLLNLSIIVIASSKCVNIAQGLQLNNDGNIKSRHRVCPTKITTTSSSWGRLYPYSYHPLFKISLTVSEI